jgi:hypothetical protein
MALLEKNISLIGASIAIETIVTPAIPNEYYPISAIRSVNATYSPSLQAVGGVYPYPSMLMVDIYFFDPNMQRLSFDIQSIANQAGWTANLAGLNQAMVDINGWITTANSLAPTGSATAANQVLQTTSLNNILADTTAIKDNTNDALGGEGTEYTFGTGVVSGKAYRYLVVNSSTGATFTTLTDSAAVDLKVDLGIGANTVEKGMIIRAKAGKTISAVTLATGSVVGVL